MDLAAALAAMGHDLDFDIAPGRARVGACPLGLRYKLLCRGLIETRRGHIEIDRERKGSGVIRSNADFALNGDLAGSELLLVREVVHRSRKAGSVPGGEELFRVGAPAVAAERWRCGKIDPDGAVRALHAAVAATD